MAGSFTDPWEVDVLRMITGQATTILTTTALSTVYVALCTSTPTDSAAGTEVSGNNYARVDSKGKWAVPSAGSVSNNATITFATPSGSWGTVTAFEIWDAITSGNRLAWATLTTPKSPTSGDTVSFASSALTITLD